jgi:hypothetical protein
VGFDADRMHRGELIAAGGAILLLAALFFLPWFALSAGGGLTSTAAMRVSLDGWHALTTTRWVLLLTIGVTIALVVFTASQRAPALPVTSSLLTCVFGGLASLLVVFRLIDHPGLTARAGVYVGLAAALAVAYGGYLSLRTESSPFGDPRSIETVAIGRTQSGSGGRTESTPAGRSGP